MINDIDNFGKLIKNMIILSCGQHEISDWEI